MFNIIFFHQLFRIFFLYDYLLLLKVFIFEMGLLKDNESILYGALSCRVWYCKNYFKNGKIETLECVTIATRGEASSAIIDRYQMAIEATAGINLQTMSSIWCKIMGNIRMAGNWILFLDVDLFTENRSLEVLQSIKRHAIARKDQKRSVCLIIRRWFVAILWEERLM